MLKESFYIIESLKEELEKQTGHYERDSEGGRVAWKRRRCTVALSTRKRILGQCTSADVHLLILRERVSDKECEP